MMYHCYTKTVQKYPDGIRCTEIHYSGYVDATGKRKLIRCVGKSFWEKQAAQYKQESAAKNTEINTDKSIFGSSRSA